MCSQVMHKMKHKISFSPEANIVNAFLYIFTEYFKHVHIYASPFLNPNGTHLKCGKLPVFKGIIL